LYTLSEIITLSFILSALGLFLVVEQSGMKDYLASGAHSEIIHNDAALLKHKTKLALVGLLKSLHPAIACEIAAATWHDEQGQAGQGRAGQGQGRAGQGRAGQGVTGQGKLQQGRV